MKSTHFFLSSVVIIGIIFFSSVSFAHAAWNYVGRSISYTVTVPPNQAPIVNAGPDQALTLPTSSVSITGTASDPDGTLSTTIWTFASGPVTPTIGAQNNSSPSPVTLSGMTSPGVYVFRFNAEDNLGLWGWDEMQVVVSAAATPSGTLSAADCSIASGGSSCSSTVSWTTSNLTANPTTVSRTTGTPSSFTVTSLPNGAQGVTLWHGTTVFSLIHNAATLASASGTASCVSGTSWDGDSCEVGGGGAVNGMCAATHWSCVSGTSQAQTGSGSGPWTWSCVGSNGGSTASCYEAASGGGGGGGGGDEKMQCADGIDNADIEDTLADSEDPGCHTDGDPMNGASYDPNDNDESNRRKPIYIEF